VSAVEVKWERDFNAATGDEVLRIFARERGTRRWSKFCAIATKSEPIPYLIEHAQRLGETWLRLEGATS
jgi:hypothetical protein